jgi:hypothetical protein
VRGSATCGITGGAVEGADPSPCPGTVSTRRRNRHGSPAPPSPSRSSSPSSSSRVSSSHVRTRARPSPMAWATSSQEVRWLANPKADRAASSNLAGDQPRGKPVRPFRPPEAAHSAVSVVTSWVSPHRGRRLVLEQGEDLGLVPAEDASLLCGHRGGWPDDQCGTFRGEVDLAGPELGQEGRDVLGQGGHIRSSSAGRGGSW